MATATWTGGGNDGDWSSASNWSGGGGAGGVPGNADDVVVNTTKLNISSGHAAFAAVNITSLTVTTGFEGEFGSDTAAIQFGTITTLRYAGSGAFGKVSATVTTAKLDHTGEGVFYIAGGTWTTVESSGGRIVKAAAATVTTYKNVGARVKAYKGTSNAFTTVYNAAGDFQCEENFGDLYNAGRFYAQKACTPTTTTAAAHVTTWRGGKTYWNSSGTVSNAETFSGGLFSAEGSKYSFTVSVHTKWRGAEIDVFYPGIVVTEASETWVGQQVGVEK